MNPKQSFDQMPLNDQIRVVLTNISKGKKLLGPGMKWGVVANVVLHCDKEGYLKDGCVTKLGYSFLTEKPCSSSRIISEVLGLND